MEHQAPSSPWERYARQIRYPKIGREGQERLAQSTVAILGCGALGSHQADLLARAGVGRLLLIDRDILAYSNLQRQTLYDEEQAREEQPKVLAAASRLRAINRDIEIETHLLDLDHRNIRQITQNVDLLLDGTDNLETRYLINEACLEDQKPWIYGACVGSHGQIASLRPPQTPCFVCLFPEAPKLEDRQNCETNGILGMTVAVTAAMQTTEALKRLLGYHDESLQGLLHLDLWQGEFFTLKMTRPRPDCPTCQQHKRPYLTGQAASQIAILCGRDSILFRPDAHQPSLDLALIASRLQGSVELRYNDGLLRIVQGKLALHLFADGRAICYGTTDLAEAKGFYARTLGA